MGPGSTPGRHSMDRDFLIDLFADFGPVTIRRMFSGFGISADGTNFALALRSGLYFRADEQTIPQFEAEGSAPFQYQTRLKTVTVNSYWPLPARLFDDQEELSVWARAALAAAQRAALRKRPRAKKQVTKKAAGKMPKRSSPEKHIYRRPGQVSASERRAGTHSRRPRGFKEAVEHLAETSSRGVWAPAFAGATGCNDLTPPGCGSRRSIPDRLRRSRGCGRCAWRRRGSRRRARSARRCRRPALAWRRRPRW